MLFPTLSAFKTSVKTTIGFTPFQLVYEIEAILLIECEIPSLKFAIELFLNTIELEKCLIYLKKLDETHRDAFAANEAHKQHVKAQYEKCVKPRVFFEGDLVLVCD